MNTQTLFDIIETYLIPDLSKIVVSYIPKPKVLWWNYNHSGLKSGSDGLFRNGDIIVCNSSWMIMKDSDMIFWCFPKLASNGYSIVLPLADGYNSHDHQLIGDTLWYRSNYIFSYNLVTQESKSFKGSLKEGYYLNQDNDAVILATGVIFPPIRSKCYIDPDYLYLFEGYDLFKYKLDQPKSKKLVCTIKCKDFRNFKVFDDYIVIDHSHIFIVYRLDKEIMRFKAGNSNIVIYDQILVYFKQDYGMTYTNLITKKRFNQLGYDQNYSSYREINSNKLVINERFEQNDPRTEILKTSQDDGLYHTSLPNCKVFYSLH